MGHDDTHMKSDERFLWVAGIRDGEVLHYLDPADPDRNAWNAWIGCRNRWESMWRRSIGYSYLVLKRLKTDRYLVTERKQFGLIYDDGPLQYESALTSPKFLDDEDAAIMYAVMKANQQ